MVSKHHIGCIAKHSNHGRILGSTDSTVRPRQDQSEEKKDLRELSTTSDSTEFEDLSKYPLFLV